MFALYFIKGDGRMDSPGHTAQYCLYTFMEYDTKTILYIVTNLEKACFVQGLRFLLYNGLRIVEVVTDAHVQVASVMSKLIQNCRRITTCNIIYHIDCMYVMNMLCTKENIYLIFFRKGLSKHKTFFRYLTRDKTLGQKYHQGSYIIQCTILSIAY